MSHYKPYPAYKDSSVEWIGKVPEHWDVVPFKRHIARNDGGVWGSDPLGTNDTVVIRSTEQSADGHWIANQPALRQLSENEKQSALLEKDDLVVTKSSGSSLHIGKTTLVTSEVAQLGCCYSNFMQRLRMKQSFLPKLAWYVMNNGIAREQLDLASNSTTGLANLNGGMIGQLLLAIPPEAEQQTLVTVLDRETARIDALIAKKTEFIDLLSKKRQALITHAVTKGLNPKAKMKDSGVEWIGEVPEHWGVRSIKGIVSTPITDGPHETPQFYNEGIPFVSAEAISGGFLNFEKIRGYISRKAHETYSRKYKPQRNDIFMIKSGATTGVTAIVDTDIEFNIWSPLAVVRCGASMVPFFVLSYMRSHSFQEGVSQNWSFGTQQNIGMGVIGDLQIPVPSLNEQQSIAVYLKMGLDRLNSLVEKTQHSIDLLKKRRSAFITAAVTGQIDLREST